MSRTVADVLVATLEQIGVKRIFGLIGEFAESARRRRSPQQHRMDRRPPRGGGGAGRIGPGEAHRPARGLRGHNRPRQHPSRRRSLRGEPRSRSGAGAVRRNGAQDAGHRLHPDHGTGSAVPRRLALHRDHLVAGSGAGCHPSGDRGRLCGPRRRASDAAAGRALGKGRRQRRKRRHAEAASRACGRRSRRRRDRPADR